MSSEVVKKRGRPRKIIPELVEVEIPVVAKKRTKAKAVKAATKTAKAKAPAMIKTAAVKRVALKSADDVAGKSIENVKAEPGAVKEVQVPLKSASEPTVPVEKNASIESAEPEAKVKDVAESLSTTKEASSETASPILAEVQKLKEEKALAGGAIKTETIPTETATAKKPSPPSLQPKTQTPVPQAAPPAPKSSTSKPTPAPPASKPTPPNPKPQIPFAQMNSEIVSKITTRAGARPNTAGSRQLPPNYKSVSRKVTMAIVAMPIVIVTSYVLYQRLVLGEERKLLVEPVPAPMEPPRVPVSTPKDSETPKTAPSS